jgi:hypothetical protein
MLIGYTFALFIIHTTPTVSYGAFLAPTPPPFFILSTLIPPFLFLIRRVLPLPHMLCFCAPAVNSTNIEKFCLFWGEVPMLAVILGQVWSGFFPFRLSVARWIFACFLLMESSFFCILKIFFLPAKSICLCLTTEDCDALVRLSTQCTSRSMCTDLNTLLPGVQEGSRTWKWKWTWKRKWT